jgi:hypothetical protein
MTVFQGRANGDVLVGIGGGDMIVGVGDNDSISGDGQWHSVAVLDGVSDLDLAALHASGQLLV